ncbi:MAG TPA: DUF456 domain-containing protein [Polyangiaceae bacterium]
MSQPLDPTLAPAAASADATVAALQGAPAAPMPDVGQPAPPAVAQPAQQAPAGQQPPVPGDDTSPGAQLLSRVPALKQQIDESAAKAAASAGALAAAPAASPGMVATREQVELPATPEQAQKGVQQLGEAQDAGRKAAEKTAQAQAVAEVNDFFLKKAAQHLAEQRYMAEKQATDAIQERVMREYQETSADELDPSRVFTGSPGTGWGLVSTILGAIVGGVALGPLGAITMAVRGVDKAIRQDLELQKEQKNSRLKQYETILGDQQLAYQRLYSQQLNLAAQQAETLAAESKARGTFAQMGAVSEQIRALHGREQASFTKDHQTKRSLEYTNEMLLKKQGPAAPTLAPETAPVLEAFRRHGVDVKDPGYRDYVQKRVEQAPYMGAVKQAGSTLENTMARLGGQDVPGYGRFDERIPVEALGPEAKAVQQTFNNAVDEFGRKKSGAAITKDEWEFLQRIARGGGSLAEMRRGVEIMRRRGQTALDEYDRGFPQYRNLQRELDGIERGQNPKTPYNEADLSIAPPGAMPGVTPAPDAAVRDQRRDQSRKQTAGGKAVSDALFGGQSGGGGTTSGADGDPDAVDEFFAK